VDLRKCTARPGSLLGGEGKNAEHCGHGADRSRQARETRCWEKKDVGK
jgi:hypothetical protein